MSDNLHSTNLPSISANKPGELPFDLLEKITELEQKILDKHPAMPALLRDIHRTLAAYPENVTLMTDEQIGIVVSGLKVHTQTTLVTTAAKKTTASVAKKLASMSIDDF